MKTTIHALLAFLLFVSASAMGQSKNPYKSIGKKSETLTLTKGKYEELFDQDSIQQVGTVLMNIGTMKVVKLLSNEEAKQRLENEKGSRFLSVDPLTHDYPELTPYQFASNRPIEAVDLDGLESKDLYMELEPVRRQRKMESAFGIIHQETKGAKAVGKFVQYSLGAIVLAPVLAEAPTLVITTSTRLFWWAAANPQTASGVAFTILVAASGYEGPDIPGPADDFGRMGRKVYDKLIAAGVTSDDALGQAARNSYKAIIGTIDNEIRDLGTWEEKARKAFNIRNKAKDFAREMSGPSNKAAAEARNQGVYQNPNGPSFEELFNKYKKDNMSNDQVYEQMIEAAKRTDEQTNQNYKAN